MRKFNVSCDLLIPVVLEIEAAGEDAAINKLYEMSRCELLRLANTEEGCIAILEGSESINED